MSPVHFPVGPSTSPVTEPTAWYNTREGLQARLLDGLDGLRQIEEVRHRAHYERKEVLSAWCLLGRYLADECGNFSVIDRGSPADAEDFRSYDQPALEDVISKDEMKNFTGQWSAVMGRALPPQGATCDRCGEGWGFRNAHDFIWIDREARGRHRYCHELAVVDREREFFMNLLAKAEVPYTKLVTIPNEYGRNRAIYGPWFWVETPKGRIKIGWRKRVINIDWTKSMLAVPGSEVVSDSKITHGKTYVHAWGGDEAVNALRRLWGSPELAASEAG